MENNNVRVQATPSHCTEQEEVKELEVKEFDLDYSALENELTKGAKLVGNLEEGLSLELDDLELTLDEKDEIIDKLKSNGFSRKPGFRCFSDDNGKLYLNVGLNKYKVVDVINKTTTVEEVESLQGINEIEIERFTLGLSPKETMWGANHVKYETKNVNAQVDYFREAVLPNVIKINNKKVKGVVDNLIATFKLDLNDNHTTDTLVLSYNDSNVVGSSLSAVKCYSRVLKQEVDFMEVLNNYFLENNMFTYPSIISMFVYFVREVPEFFSTFMLGDLQALYAGKDMVLGTNYDAINKEVRKGLDELEKQAWVLGSKGIANFLEDLDAGDCEESMNILESLDIGSAPIDVPQSSFISNKYCKQVKLKKRDLVIGCPTHKHGMKIKVMPEIMVSIESDNLVGLTLTEGDVDKLEELFKGCRNKEDSKTVVKTKTLNNATVMLNYGAGTPKEDCGFLKDIRVSMVGTSEENMITLCVEEKHIEALEKFTEMYKRKSLLEYAKKEEIKEEIKNEEVKQYGEPVRVSMNIRDIEDDYACYTEVELDFSKAHLFQYCPETGELLAKLDEDEEVYKPILKEER